MSSSGQIPKGNTYNAWPNNAPDPVERDRKLVVLMRPETKLALAELASIQSWDEFVEICRKQKESW